MHREDAGAAAVRRPAQLAQVAVVQLARRVKKDLRRLRAQARDIGKPPLGELGIETRGGYSGQHRPSPFRPAGQ